MPSRPLVYNVVNSSTDITLTLMKFLHTGILTNIQFDMVDFNLIRHWDNNLISHWNNLSFQCKVFSKLLNLLIKIDPDPDFDRDNPTHLVSSFILAALPSFRLGKCILMFLKLFTTFSLMQLNESSIARHIAILQDRSNLSPIKDRRVCYDTNFSLSISTYISILLVPINDILKTDSFLKANSVLNILKTNSVLTNIEIQLQYSVYHSRTQKLSS